MKTFITAILAALSFTATAQVACVGDTGGKVRTAYIVPQLSANQLFSSWAPILERVGRDTKQCFDIRVPATIPEFETAFLTGQADYAFMNPYHAVMAHRSKGYIPLVADSKILLDGIIVVRVDSPIETIRDLKGARMAFPAPNAFAASLLPRATLSRSNIMIDPIYVKTHSNVYRSVIMGDVVAGGGVNNTFDREPQSVRDKLRILYRTPRYTSHPFSANSRIPKSTRDEVINSFIRLSATPEGQALLDRVQMPLPVSVTYTDDYAPLEMLGLERFVQRGNN